MTLVPIYYPPGICKNTTQYAAGKEQEYVKGRVSGGRYTDCDKVRFITGYPEKIGGWVTIATTNDVNCSLCEFRDNANNVYLGIGAYGGLYVWNNTIIEDITPLLPFSFHCSSVIGKSFSGAGMTLRLDTSHASQNCAGTSNVA